MKFIKIIQLIIIIFRYNSYSQPVIIYDSLNKNTTIWTSKPDSSEYPQENDVVIFGIKELKNIVCFTDSNVNDNYTRFVVLTTKMNIPYYENRRNVEYILSEDYILIDPHSFGRNYSAFVRFKNIYAQKVIIVLDSNIVKKYSLIKFIHKLEDDYFYSSNKDKVSKTIINKEMYFEELKTNLYIVGIIRICVLQRFYGKSFEKTHLTGLYIPFAIPISEDKW